VSADELGAGRASPLSPWRHWQRRTGSQKAIAALTGLLALLAAIYAVWPLWRALFPLEIDLDEAWNAFHVQAVRSGGTLYPDPDALIANNYPPLSFLLAAGITSITGADPIFLGRVLSLASVAVVAACVVSIVRRLGGDRLGAMLGGLWLLATMLRFFDGYMGQNDPHLPALALTALGLTWALARLARDRPIEPAIVVMVIAGFYKHSLLATPVAALIWLATSNRLLALRAATLGAMLAVLGLVLCTFIYGDAFPRQLMMPRVYSLSTSLANLGQLQWIAPALAIWALWAWKDRGSPAAQLSAIYIAAALIVYLLQKLAAGIGVNAQFELVVATAIGLGCALSRSFAFRVLGPRADRVLIACMVILIVRLLASTRVESYWLLLSADYRSQFARNAEILASEVERVRDMPEPLHCGVPTVCLRAGKDFVFDGFAVAQRREKGLITAEQLEAKLRAARILFVPIDPRASTDALRIPRGR
jgi:hypothetical protein